MPRRSPLRQRGECRWNIAYIDGIAPPSHRDSTVPGAWPSERAEFAMSPPRRTSPAAASNEPLSPERPLIRTRSIRHQIDNSNLPLHFDPARYTMYNTRRDADDFLGITDEDYRPFTPRLNPVRHSERSSSRQQGTSVRDNRNYIMVGARFSTASASRDTFTRVRPSMQRQDHQVPSRTRSSSTQAQTDTYVNPETGVNHDMHTIAQDMQYAQSESSPRMAGFGSQFNRSRQFSDIDTAPSTTMIENIDTGAAPDSSYEGVSIIEGLQSVIPREGTATGPAIDWNDSLTDVDTASSVTIVGDEASERLFLRPRRLHSDHDAAESVTSMGYITPQVLPGRDSEISRQFAAEASSSETSEAHLRRESRLVSSRPSKESIPPYILRHPSDHGDHETFPLRSIRGPYVSPSSFLRDPESSQDRSVVHGERWVPTNPYSGGENRPTQVIWDNAQLRTIPVLTNLPGDESRDGIRPSISSNAVPSRGAHRREPPHLYQRDQAQWRDAYERAQEVAEHRANGGSPSSSVCTVIAGEQVQRTASHLRHPGLRLSRPNMGAQRRSASPSRSTNVLLQAADQGSIDPVTQTQSDDADDEAALEVARHGRSEREGREERELDVIPLGLDESGSDEFIHVEENEEMAWEMLSIPAQS